jgi:peptidoglycan/xylan/chitin deacetylase (PgdA/CDA1 family)
MIGQGIYNQIKAGASAIANRSGFLDAYASLKGLAKSQVIILLYHRVSPDQDNWFLAEPFSPQSFEEQVEYFSRTYELLSLDKLAYYIQQGKTLPKKALVITLDDGYKDNYLYAYPILKKHHAPATIFLATGHIGTERLFWYNKVKYVFQATPLVKADVDDFGKLRLQSSSERLEAGLVVLERLKRMPEMKRNSLVEKLADALRVNIPEDLGKSAILSWDEVREMSNDGIAFGAHTVSHPILTNVPLEEAKWEIVQSKKDIEERLEQPVTAFAYPSGGHRDFNNQVANFVKESGFLCAVTAIPRWISNKANIYELGRIRASENQNQFKVLFSGLYGDLGLYRLLQ